MEEEEIASYNDDTEDDNTENSIEQALLAAELID